uniref:Ints3-like C-terminal domain-containing protein n=1 Tax=Glossina pallidipes TaxID=7398 RepID=A0A1B0AA40_GLOPL
MVNSVLIEVGQRERILVSTDASLFSFNARKTWVTLDVVQIWWVLVPIIASKYPSSSPNKRKRPLKGSSAVNSSPSADQVLNHLEHYRRSCRYGIDTGLYVHDTMQRAIQIAYTHAVLKAQKSNRAIYLDWFLKPRPWEEEVAVVTAANNPHLKRIQVIKIIVTKRTPILLKLSIHPIKIQVRSAYAMTICDCVLALNSNGDLFGWGNSEYGQLSDSDVDNTQINIPIHLKLTQGIGKLTDVAAGGSFCMALNEEEQSSKPQRLLSPLFGRNDFSNKTCVVSIGCGVFHMGATNSDGDLFMWGKNRFGHLGLGHKKDQFFPFKTTINGKVTKVAYGYLPLFERALGQYDKLKKRGAFLDQFRREDIFKDDLSELDDSRDVVDCLVQEYEAATQPNYLHWSAKKGQEEQ